MERRQKAYILEHGLGGWAAEVTGDAWNQGPELERPYMAC